MNARVYNLLVDKDKGMIEFYELLKYMVEKRKYIHSKEYDDMRNDFEYHFDRLPNYFRENLTKFRGDLIMRNASINLAVKRISEAVDDFTTD